MEVLQASMEGGLSGKFIEADEQVWTPFLSQQQGFICKTVTIPNQLSSSVNGTDQVWIFIHWASYQGWKSIPVNELESTAAQFQSVFPHPFNLTALPGPGGFQILISRDSGSSKSSDSDGTKFDSVVVGLLVGLGALAAIVIGGAAVLIWGRCRRSKTSQADARSEESYNEFLVRSDRF